MIDAHKAGIVLQDVPCLADLFAGADALEVKDVAAQKVVVVVGGHEAGIANSSREIALHAFGSAFGDPADVLALLGRAVDKGTDAEGTQNVQHIARAFVVEIGRIERGIRLTVVDECAVV